MEKIMWNNKLHNKIFLKGVVAHVALIAVLLPCQSAAELWKLTPYFSLEGRYDDNIRLTTASHDSVTGALLSGNLGFSRLTEISEITGRLHAKYSDYSGDDEVEDDKFSAYGTFTSFYKSERSKWGLKGTFRRDTTLRRFDTTDAADDGQAGDEQNVIEDVDDGLVNIDVRRDRVQLTPSFRHNLNERTVVGLTYAYTDVSYKGNQVGSGLFDYTQNGFSAGISYGLTELDSINAGVGFARFESPDNADNEVDTIDLTAGYYREFSERTSGSIDVGVNTSTQSNDVLTRDVDNDGYIARIKLEHNTELTRYIFSVRHDLQPSGSGDIVEANRFRMDIRRRITPRLHGVLRAYYVDRENISTSSTDTDRYFTIEPRLRWKLTRWWTLKGGYKYRRNENVNSSQTADSNAVYLTLTHSKPIKFD